MIPILLPEKRSIARGGSESGQSWKGGSLSDGGHDHIHRELLCAAGRDLHRHRVSENKTGPHQEVVATPEHTWRGEGEEGVSTLQAALPCKSEDEHYCLAQAGFPEVVWQILVLDQERP